MLIEAECPPLPPHLEACPFCGSALAVVWRRSNPRASCKTPDCWSGKGIAIALDDPQQVAAWNCRKPPNGPGEQDTTARGKA